MNTRYPFAVLLFAVMSTITAYAVAATRAALPIPAADHAAIRNYPLTEDVVRRLYDVSVEAKKARLEPSPFFAQLEANSLDDVTDRILTTQPRLARIVESHGFTRRDYVMAGFALASARQTALHGPDDASGGLLHNQFVSSENASAANIAFYEEHSAELEPMLGKDTMTSSGLKPNAR